MDPGGTSPGTRPSPLAPTRAPPTYISAEINSVEYAVDRKRPFTMYVIQVSATHRGREVWVVYRRYSKFHDLHLQLEKRFRNLAPLPPIPPKRLTGTMDLIYGIGA